MLPPESAASAPSEGIAQVASRAAPLAAATIRRSPEDFVVEELPAYAPNGAGEHLFITFRKTRLTTLDAIRDLARALEVDPRATGYAGMKDRHAITTQTASFAFPIARDPAPALAGLSIPGIEILSASRHENKLKPGHLHGNRFTLVLRDIAPADAPAVASALRAAATTGVPNTFGPQRFGRDGNNPERALAWVAGKGRGPRDRREQRLIFSSLQSRLFNDLLERRVEDGTWASVLPGDLAKKHDTGGLFVVPEAGPERADAEERARAGALSATGPMYGARMRWPEGAVLALEQEVLAASGLAMSHLEAFRQLGEGTRRSLRLAVSDMTVRLLDRGPDEPAGGASIEVSFVLPKGGFATTVLASACNVIDASRGRTATGDSPSDAPDGDGDSSASE